MSKKHIKLEDGNILSFEWVVGKFKPVKVTKHGNSSHAILPKDWIGKEVLCVLKGGG